MANNWKKIWDSRLEKYNSVDESSMSEKEMFLYMKKLNGFDINEKGMSYGSLYNQFQQTEQRISKYHKCSSVFEVGCGCGAQLFLFEKQNYRIGGIDYSNSLIDFASSHLNAELVDELICDEAENLDFSIKYDSVISNSVFSYFPDFDYAERVLEKMTKKCRYSMIMIDIHDSDKKDDFIAFRKKMIADYEERYKGLPKLFYPKIFFEQYAEKHNLNIEFYNADVAGYWNNKFIYKVCLYK